VLEVKYLYGLLETGTY